MSPPWSFSVFDSRPHFLFSVTLVTRPPGRRSSFATAEEVFIEAESFADSRRLETGHPVIQQNGFALPDRTRLGQPVSVRERACGNLQRPGVSRVEAGTMGLEWAVGTGGSERRVVARCPSSLPIRGGFKYSFKRSKRIETTFGFTEVREFGIGRTRGGGPFGCRGAQTLHCTDLTGSTAVADCIYLNERRRRASTAGMSVTFFHHGVATNRADRDTGDQKGPMTSSLVGGGYAGNGVRRCRRRDWDCRVAVDPRPRGCSGWQTVRAKVRCGRWEIPSPASFPRIGERLSRVLWTGRRNRQGGYEEFRRR